jgi:protein-L-isoaspartate O-methyltransferase
MTQDTALIRWYNQHAQDIVQYDATIDIGEQQSWMRQWLPDAPALVLDVGSGSGRVAAWLAELGHQVVAMEPARALREYAEHTYAHPHIEWVNDRLPQLDVIQQRTTWAFDAIVAHAVWMCVPPTERQRAFRKLIETLKPGGVLVMRHVVDDARELDVTLTVPHAEISEFAQRNGLLVEYDECRVGADGRHWQHVVIRVPDDGTGALPFLRHIILNDRKSATYKLGLLRTMVRVADAAPGLARPDDDMHVQLPFGLIGLYWVRLYQPLTRADLPQMPANTQGGTKLGFVGAHYVRLHDGIANDLTIGSQFRGEMAHAVWGAINDACDLIRKMPATFITYDDGRPVFEIHKGKKSVLKHDYLVIDEPLLWSFGSVRVPRHMWQSMMRFCAWIEPALIYEWQNLMHAYAYSQGRKLDYATIDAAMRWYDPMRTVGPARVRAQRLLTQNIPVYCVWSGKRLNEKNFDIDHVFPWAAKPCGDMWNLVPAARAVNQHEKRDRLVSATVLDAAAERLHTWWDTAYLHDENQLIPQRFFAEARTSLAVSESSIRALLLGMHQLRLQLRKDQQIPEWRGPNT